MREEEIEEGGFWRARVWQMEAHTDSQVTGCERQGSTCRKRGGRGGSMGATDKQES